MHLGRLTRVARSIADFFPERQIFVRSGSEIRGYRLTTALQLRIAAAIGALALWTGGATAALVVSLDGHARSEATFAPSPSLDALARSMEHRHEALAMLLVGAGGDPSSLVAMRPARVDTNASPAQRIAAIRLDEDRMIAAAQTSARSRADRLRLAFRLAGLDPAIYAAGGDSLGGPLIETKDSRALAAVLDVDADFAGRIQTAATDVTAMRSLSDASHALPLGKPTASGAESSPYGVRVDPFTGRPAFHTGEDFSGGFMAPILATAPGVVSFTGVRSGYGNTVEIDHGHGFKTRYGHLAAFSVKVGQSVALGQRIGGMGSTGRSTGDHLHYEVWVNGRPQNPSRFLKAGDYVQQTE